MRGQVDVHVALEEYAALPPQWDSMPAISSPLLLHSYLKLSEMPAQESAACNGSDLCVPGVAPCADITQERIERCELILDAVLRERPEFFKKHQNDLLCERKGGGSGDFFAHLKSSIHPEHDLAEHSRPVWPG
jgi:hypothetical protein